MVILDARRSKPFAVTLKRTARESRDVGGGLTGIEPARGTEVVYSAKERSIAADGDGADSPFRNRAGAAPERAGRRSRQAVPSRPRRRARRHQQQAGALRLRLAAGPPG